jgi:transforming growth factor-beta-induced protein
MKKFKLFFMIFLSAGVLLTACSDDDDDDTPAATPPPTTPTDPSIADIVINSPDHDSLEKAALRFPDLLVGLSGAATYTVFAPTNDAFATFLNGTAINDVDSATLRSILAYHAIDAAVIRSTDLMDNTYATTLRQGDSAIVNGELLTLKADVTGGVTINGSASVTTADLDASNGIVHVVNEVLVPQSIVDFATKDSRFSLLVEALTAYPSYDYVNTLSGTGPFTVFAPTNDAFQALLDSDPSWNTVNDIDSVTLAAVLEYHVVGGANVQADELNQGQTITTLGGDLTVDLTSGPQLNTTSSSQGAVNIIITNVQGSNGVIHAVDEVLLP